MSGEVYESAVIAPAAGMPHLDVDVGGRATLPEILLQELSQDLVGQLCEWAEFGILRRSRKLPSAGSTKSSGRVP